MSVQSFYNTLQTSIKNHLKGKAMNWKFQAGMCRKDLINAAQLCCRATFEPKTDPSELCHLDNLRSDCN